MKQHILFLFLLTVTTSNALAQNYKTLEWDVVGLTRIMPTSNNAAAAFGFYNELRVNLNNQLSIGIKYENHFFKNYFEEPIRGQGTGTSISLTSDYYVFNNMNKRGFVGMAVGMFNNSETTESGMDVGGSGLGITPRCGYEFSFLRITAAYNYTLKKEFPNYMGVGLSFNIGGKYRP